MFRVASGAELSGSGIESSWYVLKAALAVPAVVAEPAFVALSALVAWPAFAALSALVAWPAFVALVALAAVAADGTWPKLDSLTSAPVIAPFLTFDEVTAFRLSCFVPTLLFGRDSAAYELPPSATNTATVAMTLA
jgi:hypothetical protein